MEEEKLKEQYLKKYGWIKKKGYKINVEDAKNQDWEDFYFPEEDYKDYIFKVEYWENPSYEDIFEDIDFAIEKTEDDEEEEFEDFKNKEVKK